MNASGVRPNRQPVATPAAAPIHLARRTDGSAVPAGAGIVRDAADPQLVIVATGSEVALAVAASEALAGEIRVRVVSMPSWDRFERQGDDVRAAILPTGVPVLSVEAATTFGWARWADRSIGIDRFGASAPGAVALDRLGINLDHVVTTARDMVAG